MKFFISALLVASAAAFAPATNERASTALNMDRRAAVGAIAGAALVAAPTIASAGAETGASVQRAKFLYGSRIAALDGAVASGDFGAVAAEKNAFILFNSGVYSSIKSKASKEAAISGTNAIFSAIRSKDKAALKSAYDSYVASNGITAYKTIDSSYGQGYSGDFDYRVRSNQATIYVR